MILLISGLLLWSVVHLIPSIAPGLKESLQLKFGMKTYKIGFTLLIVCSLLLIIFGWRNSEPQFLYQFNNSAHYFFLGLNIIAFILFGAAKYPTRIKRFVRHPQLTGVLLWATAHLLLNGDCRSVWLFGVLALWTILEMIFISKREGPWAKPPAPPWGREIRGLCITSIIIVVLIFIHPYIAGVSVY